jgi:hexosaminidase
MKATLTRTLILRTAILGALAFGCAGASAQTPNVQIIPAPKQLTAGEEKFDIGLETRMALADPQSAEDRFAAQDFIDDVKQTAGVTVRLGGNGARREILIGRIDLPRIQQALKRAAIDLSQQLNDEGYVVSVGLHEVVVAGKTTTGTFYGLQTLKQVVRGDGGSAFIPGMKVVDWPTMRWRAVSDDISRGPVPTVDYIKRQIRTEAFFKLNMHSFYMEHTFASESNPLIGPAGGSLTPAEIRELVAYRESTVLAGQRFGSLRSDDFGLADEEPRDG